MLAARSRQGLFFAMPFSLCSKIVFVMIFIIIFVIYCYFLIYHLSNFVAAATVSYL